MAYSYEELHKKTVAQLRKIAEELDKEELRGFMTMHKFELLPALCKALGIEAHAHHKALGIDKTGLKAQIDELKKRRDAAAEAGDMEQLRHLRHKIKRLKRKIRRATV